MHSGGMPDTYFISQFIRGLKPELRYAVQGQVPHSMERAAMLAKIQQRIQDKSTKKGLKTPNSTRWPAASSSARMDQHKPVTSAPLSKERQLRDYCRTHNLCFYCREPHDATHASKCTKRPKAQANALMLNDLDINLIEEVLTQLDIEDALAADFGTLSLNAIPGTDDG